MVNARRKENCRVTGLQHAGGRGCAVTILERVVRSFLEKLTPEQRFDGVREWHMDILKKDSPVGGCSQREGRRLRSQRSSERRAAGDGVRQETDGGPWSLMGS